MSLPNAVVAHDLAMRRISAAVMLQSRRLWAQLGESGSFDAAWLALGPRLFVLLSAAQLAAARDAVAYTSAVVAELGLPDQQSGQVAPAAFSGVASDGRPLDSLLAEPLIAAKTLIGHGVPVANAMDSGGSQLDRIVSTQVADAGREAVSVGTTTRPGISGYVRMVSTPCCGRCALLAGKHYRWNAGFQRHPQCDCRNIPCSENIAGDLTTDPVGLFKSGQVRGLSQADTKAIADGADPGQVVNAHRGVYTTTAGVKATTAGMTRAGLAGQRLGRKATRLMPSSIYKLAGDDRAKALALLKAHAFII